MDANLQFWRREGQSFFQRFLLWLDALDPLLLLKSSDEIRSSRCFLQDSVKTASEPMQNDQARQAFLLSLSSVQPDTDHIIPILCRPPAFLPISLPLVILSSVQLQAKQNFFYQFAFHTHTTVFTLLNGNHTAKAEGYSLPEKQIYLGLGAISYASCIGAFPLVFMNRYMSKNPLGQLIVKKLLHAPLLGLMSAFTVAVVRSPEFENGIEVMDRNGNVVGVSKKAGEKAVRETALSRAVLFGTTFFLPTVLMSFVESLGLETAAAKYKIKGKNRMAGVRTQEVKRHLQDLTKLAKTPRALASVRMLLITSVLAWMLPVSLSLYPQCGEIKRADLEPEIVASTEAAELFYNRGI